MVTLGNGGGSIFKRFHRPALAADSVAAAAAWCEYHLIANCYLKVHNANLNLKHRQFRDKLSKINSLITVIKLYEAVRNECYSCRECNSKEFVQEEHLLS